MTVLQNPLQAAPQPALRPPFGLSQGVTRAQVIAALFGASEQGAMYDPSDLSTLFQDSAGTTPVTADSQPVGRMLDLSGNGNHATQATAARRPLYRTDGTLHWLEFDGVDDHLLFPVPAPTAPADSSLLAGLKTADGSAVLFGSSVVSNLYVALWLAGDTSNVAQNNTSVFVDRAALTLRKNGVITPSATAGQLETAVAVNQGIVISTTNARTYNAATGVIGAFYTGATATAFHYAGDIYGYVYHADSLNLDAVTLGEQWIASKTGVAL